MEYNNSGILFKNKDKKSEDDGKPEYTGEITVEGKKYRIAQWSKQGKKGEFKTLNVSEFKQRELDKTDDLPF